MGGWEEGGGGGLGGGKGFVGLLVEIGEGGGGDVLGAFGCSEAEIMGLGFPVSVSR